MSTGLALFDTLCQAANAVEALRDTCVPGSDAWCALTQIVQSFDAYIDALVRTDGLDDEA